MQSDTATQVEGVVSPLETAGPLTSIGGQPFYPPNPDPPQEAMQQAIQFTSFNPVTNFLSNVNVRAPGNPLVWSGMKSVRDLDIDNVIKENWNTRLQLAAWSPHKPLSDLENDMFIRSLTEFPWGNTGNVAFFCNEKKVLRCHGILLQCVLPEFYKGLIGMANFQYSPSFWSPELPYIPIYVPGANLQCIENLVSLIFRGEAIVTGEELYQLLRVIELLKIHELEVCIGTTDKSCNIKGLTTSEVTTAQPTASNSRAVSVASVSAPFYGRFQQIVKTIIIEPSQAISPKPMTIATQDDPNNLKLPGFQTLRASRTPKAGLRTDYSRAPKTGLRTDYSRTRAASRGNLGKKLQHQQRMLEWEKSHGDNKSKAVNKKLKKRTVYSKDLREKVLDASNEGKKVRDVGRALNLPSKVISRWRYEAKRAATKSKNVSVHTTVASPVYNQETLTVEENQNEGEPVSVPEIPVVKVENLTVEEYQNECEPVSVPEIPVVKVENLTVEDNQNEGEPVSVPEIPVVKKENLTVEDNQNEGEPVCVLEIPVVKQENLTVEDNQDEGEPVSVPEIPVVKQENLTVEDNQDEGEPVSVPEIPVVKQENLAVECNQNEGEPVSVPEIPEVKQENLTEYNQNEGESGQ